MPNPSKKRPADREEIDAKTGQITDQPTIGFIRQQLEAFAKFMERFGGRG